jgi:hypothetical protein
VDAPFAKGAVSNTNSALMGGTIMPSASTIVAGTAGRVAWVTGIDNRAIVSRPAIQADDLSVLELVSQLVMPTACDRFGESVGRQIEECSVSADETFWYLFTEVGPRTDLVSRPFARRERAENSRMELA